MAGFPQSQHFIAAGCLFIQFWWPLYSVSSETLRFDRYRDRDLSRLQNFKDVETETQRDSRIWRMSRPRLIETKNFRGCRDRDSSRLKNLEDVETETDRDSPKGVETETETESLATHCCSPISKVTISAKLSSYQCTVGRGPMVFRNCPHPNAQWGCAIN